MKVIILPLICTLALLSCETHIGPQVPDKLYQKTSAAPAATQTKLSGDPQALSDAQLLPSLNEPNTPAPATSPSYGSALIPAPTSTLTTPAPASSQIIDLNTPTPISTTSNSPTVVSPGYAPLPQQAAATPTPAPIPSVAVPADAAVPVAKQVPGDPHRVYNPYNPQQTIRITNPKTGLPFPSGKKLGIPGSTNRFIVP